MRIGFILNDERIVLDLDPQTSLLELLREEMGLRSMIPGCGKGSCGACLVLVDSQAVPSCLIPAFAIREKTVETVEFLSTTPAFADIEKSFLTNIFNPCAWCAPSKVILAESILRNDTPLTQVQILHSLPLHWCQCTSREEFCKAVQQAQELRQRRKGQHRG